MGEKRSDPKTLTQKNVEKKKNRIVLEKCLLVLYDRIHVSFAHHCVYGRLVFDVLLACQ